MSDTSPSGPVSRRRVSILWLLFGAALAAVFVVLGISFLLFRLGNAAAVRRLTEEVQAKGEPLTLRDLATTYGQIPDAENSAVPLLALWESEDPKFWQAYRSGRKSLPERNGKNSNTNLPAFARKANEWGSTNRLGTEQRLEATRFLQEHRAHMETVREAVKRPHARFPIRFEQGYLALLPQLAKLKDEAQCFLLEAALESEQGNVAKALEAIKTTTQIGHVMRDDPLLIDQLVRIACYRTALQEIEHLLNVNELEIEPLMELEQIIDGLRMDGAMKLCVLGDRAMDESMFDPSGTYRAELFHGSGDDSNGSAPHSSKWGNMGLYGVLGFDEADHRFLLETLRTMIRLSEDPINPTSIRAIEDLFSEAEFKAKVRRFPPKIISGMLLPALSKIPVKFADFEALRLAAKTSVAIEKYRRSHARHAPEALSNAVGPIPLDPYDGQPLRYRKLGIGYTIYSVGADREDNQGRAKPLKSPFHHWDVAFSVAR